VESIDAAGRTGRTTEYVVPAWVRVRREEFGLLFYDTRSTRLTFVKSGLSLTPPPFTGLHRALGVDATELRGSQALRRLLDNLVVKGLVVVDEPE
jgi:putative mycofactocin binding protein MftB